MAEHDRVCGACHAIEQLMRLQRMATERAGRIADYARNVPALPGRNQRRAVPFRVLGRDHGLWGRGSEIVALNSMSKLVPGATLNRATPGAVTQLNQAAGFQREDTVAVRLDKLEALLSQGRSNLGEALPLIAELLTIPTDGRCKPLDLSPQQRKQRTLATLVAQVEGLAADQPVMMLFEDAHWSDPTSLELMDLLVDRVPTLPVLVVVTFRPEFASSWVGRPHVTSLSLSRLSPRHCIAVIAGITDGKALPKELADQITERSDGVPLFIEELTKAVLESGALVDVGDRYMATRPLPSVAIPTTLEGSLLARLDRLASARETAQIGAALGRRFSHELIAAVAAMPPQQLEELADTARDCRALVPARHATRRRIHLQARPCAKRRLQQLTAQQAPAVAWPHCRDLGKPIPRDRCWPSRGSWRSIVAEAGTQRESSGLLALKPVSRRWRAPR